MNRPAGVTTTALLMGITNAMGWGIIDWRAPHAVIRFVIYTILIVIGYAVIWFYWQGENWARVFVLACSVMAILNLTAWNQAKPGVIIWLMHVMVAAEAALGLFLIFWLNNSKIRRWYKGGHFTG